MLRASSPSTLFARAYGTRQLKEVTNNQKLIRWVDEKQRLLKPKNVRVISGSDEVTFFFVTFHPSKEIGRSLDCCGGSLLDPDWVMCHLLQEYKELCKLLVDNGTMEPLNPKKRPNSFLARTDPGDVAR